MEEARLDPDACKTADSRAGTDSVTVEQAGRHEGKEPSRSQELESAREVLCEKWKPTIVRLLMQRGGGPLRYSELQRLIPGPTHKVLTEQLVDLVRDGIVCRREYTHSSRHVEYSLTALGTALQPVISALEAWAGQYDVHRHAIAVRESKRERARHDARWSATAHEVPAQVRPRGSVDGELQRVLHIGPERG